MIIQSLKGYRINIYIDNIMQINSFTSFTFPCIKMENGKKKPIGMPSWREINEDNYKEYINKDHHCRAIITGKLSGITVLDFDIDSSYHQMVENFPELKKVKTIKTNKGYHLYFKYDESVLTTVNGFDEYDGVDIRNDKAVVFAPPTKYKMSDGTVFQYEDIGGDIIPFPEEIKTSLKQWNKKQKVEKVETVNKVDNSSEKAINLSYCQKSFSKGIFFQDAQDYNSWTKMGLFLKGYFGNNEKAYQLFDTFSKMGIDGSYNKNAKNREIWNDFKTNCEYDNFGIFVNWEKKYDKKMDRSDADKADATDDVDGELRNDRRKQRGIPEGNDSLAATTVLNNYPHWVCCCGLLYVFDDTTGMWSNNIDVQNNVISRFEHYLHIYKKTVDGVRYTGKNYAENNQKRKDMYPYIRQRCVNDDWIRKTEKSSLGKILFLNGHYDFKRSVFIKGRISDESEEENGFNPEIVFHCRIDHNFTFLQEGEANYIKSIKERYFVLPLGEEVGNYLILNLARALAGDVMKRILFGLGTSNTGKGILTKACQASMGQYCGTFNGECLSLNNSSNDEAQKMRWVYLLRYKRLIISNEISATTSTLDGNIIKKISSGGDTMQGRVHQGLETDFTPQFLTLALANDLPKIIPYDVGVDNRARVISYTKSFVDEPKGGFELKIDYTLENEMKTLNFQKCFIQLLIESYAFFQKDRIEIEPSEVCYAKKDWLGIARENDIMTSFLETFEFTNNKADSVKSKEIEEWIGKTKEMSYSKFCVQMKKYCVTNGKTIELCRKKIKNKQYQAWTGILISKIEEDI